MKTILLKFSGPLQSWGTSSHFETRHTDFYPSKSAIVGLIAACLGYRRDEDDKIEELNDLDFAVRVDQQGNITKDYQTVHGYTKSGQPHTYVTNRYYLEDAIFVVAISHTDKKLITMIEKGLRNPYFQPFMGRRSCPVPADFVLGTGSESVVNTLRTLEWQAGEWSMKSQSDLSQVSLELYADSHLTEQNHYQLRQDRVVSFSQKERRFGFRYESRMIVPVQNPFYKKNTDHNVFDFIGEE
ncbi:type I-E CRISPR-associated protein Cas5/CasD [Streptococcus ratti]|uniref:Type I-E CRISPR-associated protein Cas5/CasD n=1 Tax=Streptococcus ratti TaxID=1341 RepID=A0A7X9QGB1_STRRT|nr:type I-E CRISPR-associated protein Cas5/CasD [Streptococcus ratti]NMD49268.1 type I-E CRISPR-associated protein Cas5/CasD [Streptococcus ratti]